MLFVRLQVLAALALCHAVALAAAPIDVPARVEAAARQWLTEQATLKGLVEPQFEIHVASSTQAQLAPCAQAVTVTPVETRYLSRMRFMASCAGAEGWQREWIVRAGVSALAVVAAADVPANRALAESDLAQERRRLTDLADALPGIEAAVGQASTRALRTGQLVSAKLLAQPVLLRRGASVAIVARNGPIEVTVAGEALEAGRKGEIVRVRNTATGKVIRARVLDGAVVEPESIVDSSVLPQSRD